jgi:hypothetical protein
MAAEIIKNFLSLAYLVALSRGLRFTVRV